MVRTLQGEKDDLLESVRSSEEKFQAEKNSNIKLREHVKRLEDKYQAEEREDDDLRDQRPPLKRPNHSSNARESEGDKADNSRKKATALKVAIAEDAHVEAAGGRQYVGSRSQDSLQTPYWIRA